MLPHLCFFLTAAPCADAPLFLSGHRTLCLWLIREEIVYAPVGSPAPTLSPSPLVTACLSRYGILLLQGDQHVPSVEMASVTTIEQLTRRSSRWIDMVRCKLLQIVLPLAAGKGYYSCSCVPLL